MAGSSLRVYRYVLLHVSKWNESCFGTRHCTVHFGEKRSYIMCLLVGEPFRHWRSKHTKSHIYICESVTDLAFKQLARFDWRHGVVEWTHWKGLLFVQWCDRIVFVHFATGLFVCNFKFYSYLLLSVARGRGMRGVVLSSDSECNKDLLLGIHKMRCGCDKKSTGSVSCW